MYSALPALTTSCRAASVSSIGVCGIEAVDLVEIDVIGAEPAQAVVDGMADVLARQALLVRIGRPWAVEHLGGDDHLVACRDRIP